MKKLTFCCNCDKVFETEPNLYNYDPNDSIDIVTCPHCNYYLIVSYNTMLFNDNYDKNMDWNDFLKNGIEIKNK